MISRILQLLLIDIRAVGISVDVHHARTLPPAATDGEGEGRRALISHLDS
jgi:glucokinase